MDSDKPHAVSESTAQRVDDQMLTYMQAHAIPGPWAAGERILVCVNEHPSAAGLIRYARAGLLLSRVVKPAGSGG